MPSSGLSPVQFFPHRRSDAEPHLQEREVLGVLHHGDLKVAHYNFTACVLSLRQVVLDF